MQHYLIECLTNFGCEKPVFFSCKFWDYFKITIGFLMRKLNLQTNLFIACSLCTKGYTSILGYTF